MVKKTRAGRILESLKRLNEEKYLSDEQIENQYTDFKVEELKISKGSDDLTFVADMWIEFPNAEHPDYPQGQADHVLVYWKDEKEVEKHYWPTFSFSNWYPEKILNELEDIILEKIFELRPDLDKLFNESLKPSKRLYEDNIDTNVENFLNKKFEAFFEEPLIQVTMDNLQGVERKKGLIYYYSPSILTSNDDIINSGVYIAIPSSYLPELDIDYTLYVAENPNFQHENFDTKIDLLVVFDNASMEDKIIRGYLIFTQAVVDKYLKESLKSSKRVRKSVNETIYDKYGNALTDEEWNKRETQGLNEISDDSIIKTELGRVKRMKDIEKQHTPATVSDRRTKASKEWHKEFDKLNKNTRMQYKRMLRQGRGVGNADSWSGYSLAKGGNAALRDYKSESMVNEKVNRYATEDDGDAYLDSFEYIYSQKVNGNISDYKAKLKELQQNGELKAYQAWAEEMSVDPEIVRFLESKQETKPSKKSAISEELHIMITLGDYTPWSGAVETFDKIEEAGMLDDLEFMLEDMYPDGIGQTELNDLLWFDGEWVLAQLGIEEPEEDMEESLNEISSERFLKVEKIKDNATYANRPELNGREVLAITLIENGKPKDVFSIANLKATREEVIKKAKKEFPNITDDIRVEME